MKTAKTILFIFLVILPLLYFSCGKSGNVEFIHLPMYTVIDTFESKGTVLVAKEEIYLMRNYVDEEKIELQIDSFVCEISELQKTNYDQFLLSFVKESRVSNLKKFEENERNLIRYSADNDFLYSYHFDRKHGFNYRFKYKQGISIGVKYSLVCY